MIERILKNWKTTVIGLAILITCFVLVFVGKASLTEVGAFICGGFYVLFSKDSLLKKKENLLLMAFFLLPFLSGCRSYRTFERVSETIERDTLREIDTVHIKLSVSGDTVVICSDSLRIDTVEIKQLLSGHFTLPPWDTCTRYAYACAGITNDIPWLRLEQKGITVDTSIYVERIRILERQLRETESRRIDREKFYKNLWFWMAVCLIMLHIIRSRYARN